MNEIKCPHCGQAFTVDESGYAALLQQVRDTEFAREVAANRQLVEQAAAANRESAVAQAREALSEELAKARAEAERSRAQVELERQKAAAELAEALGQARAGLQERIAQAERERDELRHRLDAQRSEAELREKALVADQGLRSAEERRKLETERDRLLLELDRAQAGAEELKLRHANELASQAKMKDEAIAVREREIENMRRMRAELSTKMVGESLERFCEDEFNKLRATGFQTASFGKDNDVVDGSKGDYVYREFDQAGAEVVSIMFEMKNEMDATATKKRNEDHFKKLDQDRRNKKCEYAVLVSLLERDSDYYNTGIVDVSFASGYPKMYVIRPQFFIPLITLIRNEALRSLGVRRELEAVRRQNIDVSNFEDQLGEMKERFGKNVDVARRKFQAAIDDIDATIRKLEKIKAELTSSDRNLDLANRKLEDITVKKLTRKNPTMKAKFDEARALRAESVDGSDDEHLAEAVLLDDE
ncbi:DUF2130 domain-containing protein [Eggerthellaceae bacterium zg-1084]|uniref:DUF2130 domain-containing protein n=1 Tax=Berryella wangjianweii TaxID=2734634 RepID=UPI001555AB1D|nr:DUF2130 domain-containing protein [Berryella wangjianweii]NPD31365.1 DUF2130 domain-containing protein [Berryella wangjianweii]